MEPNRAYIVGETVLLRTRVSQPGTKIPVDPDTVKLTSLTLTGQETLAEPVTFTREGIGDYALSIQTAGLTPGVYDLVVTYTDGVQVTIDRDTFVLQEA